MADAMTLEGSVAYLGFFSAGIAGDELAIAKLETDGLLAGEDCAGLRDIKSFLGWEDCT